VPGDAAATATNITANETLFRLGTVAFLVVIILDVVVAWGLYVLLEPVSRSVAVLMAWARLVFAVIFAVAVVNLLSAVHLVTDPTYQAAFEPTQLNAQMMASLNAFSLDPRT
jgi:mannose-1-phosphate guanylyltransferase